MAKQKCLMIQLKIFLKNRQIRKIMAEYLEIYGFPRLLFRLWWQAEKLEFSGFLAAFSAREKHFMKNLKKVLDNMICLC